MPFNPQKTLTSSKLKPARFPDRAKTQAVRLPAGVTYPAGQVLEEVTANAAQNEVQTLTFGGTPSGGTVTLLFPAGNGYDAVGPVAWSGTAATLAANISAALAAYFGTGQVAVTGTGPFTLTYSGSEVSNRDIALPSLVNNLTGTSPTITPASTTPGSPGAVGYFQAYSAGNARAVLENNVRTDARGFVIDEFGSTQTQTAAAYISGEFFAADLTGLDATAVPANGTAGTLGKLKSGASIAAAGAVVEVL